MSIVPLLLVFWALQVAAYVIFKYGSSADEGHSRRWWICFVGGNLPGGASMYFLMRIYELMPTNPNLAIVLAGSGAFIAGQITLAWMFRSRLTPTQWVGVALVAAGTAVATWGGPTAILGG